MSNSFINIQDNNAKNNLSVSLSNSAIKQPPKNDSTKPSVAVSSVVKNLNSLK